VPHHLSRTFKRWARGACHRARIRATGCPPMLVSRVPDLRLSPCDNVERRINQCSSRRPRRRSQSCAWPCRRATAPPSVHRAGSRRAWRFPQRERRNDPACFRDVFRQGREHCIAGLDLTRMKSASFVKAEVAALRAFLRETVRIGEIAVGTVEHLQAVRVRGEDAMG